MRLISLDIAEFRNLRRRSFPMSPEWNLLIGANDSGKSNILEAAASTLQTLTNPALDPTLRAQITVGWGDSEYIWRTGEPESDPTDEAGCTELRERLRFATQQKRDRPVLAYYRSTATLPVIDLLSDTPVEQERPIVQRLQTLASAPPSDTRRTVIRQAVEQALSEIVYPPDSVHLVPHQGSVGVSVDRGEPKPIRAHGAGLLRLFTIASDLAYRCCTTNPQLGANAPTATTGIILIDDLEANLHPSRQRTLVDDLSRAFPEMQFIAASHSPFLVQSIHAGQVIDLGGHDTSEAPNLSIEDITEGIMGVRVPQRSKRYLDMNAAATEAARLIRSADGASEEQKGEIRQKLDRLSMPFSNNQAFHAFLAMERLEAGLLEDED